MDSVDWVGIVETDVEKLLPEEICFAIGIDFHSSGFGDEEWQVSLPESALAICLRNMVLYLAKTGFGNTEIDDALRLTIELYKALVSSGNQSAIITDVEIFVDICRKYGPLFSSTKYTLLIEYLHRDLLQHINLYKFCSIGKRQSGARTLTAVVDTPPNNDSFPPLKKGLKKDICEYEMKMKLMEEMEATEKSKISEEQSVSVAKAEETSKQIILNKMDEFTSMNTPQYKDVLENINFVAKQYAEILSSKAISAVATMEVDMRYKLEKTCIPRPPKLGPPPRFKLKPVIQAPKSDVNLMLKESANNGIKTNSGKGTR